MPAAPAQYEKDERGRGNGRWRVYPHLVRMRIHVFAAHPAAITDHASECPADARRMLSVFPGARATVQMHHSDAEAQADY